MKEGALVVNEVAEGEGPGKGERGNPANGESWGSRLSAPPDVVSPGCVGLLGLGPKLLWIGVGLLLPK